MPVSGVNGEKFTLKEYPTYTFDVKTARNNSRFKIGDIDFSVFEDGKSEPVFTYKGSDFIENRKDVGELFEEKYLKKLKV